MNNTEEKMMNVISNFICNHQTTLSDKDYARFLGISRRYLRRLKSGKVNITIDKLSDIVTRLNATITVTVKER